MGDLSSFIVEVLLLDLVIILYLGIHLVKNTTPFDMAEVDDGVKPDLVVTGHTKAETENEATAVGEDDDGIIPRGEIDPVYEAKARVLNRAVCVPGCWLVYPLNGMLIS